MAYPDAEVVDWVSAVLGTEVTVLRGLRNGDSPWLLRAGDREVVLRVAPAERAAETATEVAAMTFAARAAGAVPYCRLRNCSATTSRSGPGTGSCSAPGCRGQA